MAISWQRIIRSTSCVVVRRVFGVGGSNAAISSSSKCNRYVPYVGENNARRAEPALGMFEVFGRTGPQTLEGAAISGHKNSV